jgi:hypothetical protein
VKEYPACDVELEAVELWTLAEAIELCTLIEGVSPPYHAHPALTGGLLYKTGPRKDCDIVIYQHGEHDGLRPGIDWDGLWRAFDSIGLALQTDYGYCKKCLWRGKQVDILDPTCDSEYGSQQGDAPLTRRCYFDQISGTRRPQLPHRRRRR